MSLICCTSPSYQQRILSINKLEIRPIRPISASSQPCPRTPLIWMMMIADNPKPWKANTLSNVQKANKQYGDCSLHWTVSIAGKCTITRNANPLSYVQTTTFFASHAIVTIFLNEAKARQLSFNCPFCNIRMNIKNTSSHESIQLFLKIYNEIF